MIPRLGGENKLLAEWDDKSTWDSIPAQQFIFLRDYAADLTTEIFAEVNAVHGKVFDAADSRFGGGRIVAPAWNSNASPRLSAVSDSTYSFPPPSGQAFG
jgi:hypothetical protein